MNQTEKSYKKYKNKTEQANKMKIQVGISKTKNNNKKYIYLSMEKKRRSCPRQSSNHKKRKTPYTEETKLKEKRTEWNDNELYRNKPQNQKSAEKVQIQKIPIQVNKQSHRKWKIQSHNVYQLPITQRLVLFFVFFCSLKISSFSTKKKKRRFYKDPMSENHKKRTKNQKKEQTHVENKPQNQESERK